MDFVELLSDGSKRRRLLGVFAAFLTLSVALAALGVAMDVRSLTVIAIVLLAGLVGIAGKTLSAVAVYLNGTTKRLKVLNDRYDDTEIWLEQFDKGTRATFTNLLQKLKDAEEDRKDLADAIATLRAEAVSASERVSEALRERATREALDATVKASQAHSAKLLESVERFGQDVERLKSTQGSLGKKADEVSLQSAELTKQIQILLKADERLGASIESAEKKLVDRIDEQDRLRKAGLQTAMKESLDSARKEIAKSTEKIDVIDRNLKSASSLTGRLRGEGYAQFGRLISADFMKEIQGELGKKLGIDVSQRELRYLERKVQHLEALCEGRLATTAEDAVARVLAARSQRGDEIRVLEIGVLFGVGAAFMHMALAPFYKNVKLVLLDPFDGYYGSEHLDPLTGQKVSRAAVDRNFARAAIRNEDVFVLEGFSTDDRLLEEAKELGPYDVIVIDGDHSYQGVEADFVRYADLVKAGGILIVDDYGSDDWPDVTKFVDAVVVSDDRFEQVGTLSRTAIFRRQSVPAEEAQVERASKPAESPKGQRQAGSQKSTGKQAASRSKRKASLKDSPSQDETTEPVLVQTRSSKKAPDTNAKSDSKAKALSADGTER